MTPFPGMDPYLEGHRFHDFHNTLTAVLKRLIVPLIVPKYETNIESQPYYDTEQVSEPFYPDPGLFQSREDRATEPESTYTKLPPFTPSTARIPKPRLFGIRIPRIEIRNRDDHQLITVIEILSPVNKRMPGLETYQKKYLALQQAGVHLLEIDLLRKGTRTFDHPIAETADYVVKLSRGNTSELEIWAIDLKDPLPVIPVPLTPPDPDIALDLTKAMHTTYTESQYQYSIDYTKEPPPPVITEGKRKWVKERIKNSKAKQ